MSEPVDLERRFGGLGRLYGGDFHQWLLGQAHAVVVGVGGVGSWAVEALARSGVGRITLIDMDHVAESNINRQIQAQDLSLGQAKTQALADRIASYAPTCEVKQVDDFLTPENAADLLDAARQWGGPYTVVLDCCDQVAAKQAMVLLCRPRKLPLWLAGSAGGKTQPWLLTVADLKDTTHDPLLAKLRYQLRRQHGYGQKPEKPLGVSVVYSPEAVRKPAQCDAQAGLNCAGYGSAVTVTASMGMQLAAQALNHWAKQAR